MREPRVTSMGVLIEMDRHLHPMGKQVVYSYIDTNKKARDSDSRPGDCKKAEYKVHYEDEGDLTRTRIRPCEIQTRSQGGVGSRKG